MIFAAKNPRILKETKPLLMPWLCALFAGALFAAKPLVSDTGLGSLLLGLTVYGFLGGLAMVASLAFGQEFHNQTMSLLLSQPLPRSQIWRQKLTIVAGLVSLAVVIECVWLAGAASWYPADELWNCLQQDFKAHELLLGAVFLLATVCSCGYWAMVTQSSIGGLVLAVATLFVSALAFGLSLARALHQADPLENPVVFKSLLIGALVYSAFFLWLGRRKFLLLELKAPRAMSSEGAKSPWRVWSVKRLGLVCTNEHKLLNLVRKEIRMLKPAFQLAGAFLLSWFIVVLVQSTYREASITYLFDVMTCLYAPLTALLGGCLTLGEEKALGITETQLILPIGRLHQWLLKLLTCFLTVSFLSLVLPLSLFWATSPFLDLHQSGFIQSQDNGFVSLACICGFAFFIAFWAMPHVRSTVQATLVTIIAAVVVPLCAAAGIWCGQATEGMFTWPVVAIMRRFDASPVLLDPWALARGQKLAFGAAAVVFSLLLYQGFRRFSRAPQSYRRLIANSGLIVALVLAVSFVDSDYRSAVRRLVESESQRLNELVGAMNAIVSTDPAPETQITKVISPNEISGKVSQRTLQWLRHATISYTLTTTRSQNTAYQGLVVFPNGRRFKFNGTVAPHRLRPPGRPR